LDKRKFHVSD